ncbi:MAG: sirohydrochlorin chelatase [Planctomycetes bacterium]|nr:sirohydrochlorin chelatase [Planctomycetota bacterium]
MTNDQTGMLLVGHGTRDQRGVAEFLKTVAMVSELLPDVIVEAGFLEYAEPSIDTALKRLVNRDVHELVVVPLLLFAAGHAQQDLPDAVAKSIAPSSQVKIRQAEPLGCHSEILAASTERYLEALDQERIDVTGDVALVMVGRGTSDEAAISDVRKFVELRTRQTPAAEVYTAFLAVADPSVDEILRSVQRSPCSTIVVQPHLLFHGKLVVDLQSKVVDARASGSSQQILLARHLGPCHQVALAAVDRFHETEAALDI